MTLGTGLAMTPSVAFARSESTYTGTGTGTGATPSGPAVISGAQIKFGVVVPGGTTEQYSQQLQSVAVTANEKPSLVTIFSSFGDNSGAPLSTVELITSRGATPIVTWEPWVAGMGSVQDSYQNADVSAGSFDSYITSWATAIAQWGKPLMIRYGHEMNGSWYPWSDGVNGNSSGSYVAAYRHVHDLFTVAGANNVSWIWNPNTIYPGSTPLATAYPGSAYVDYVGADGYNWGTSSVNTTWRSPTTIFGATLTQLRSVAPSKPIMIGEVASTELGGSKAKWNRQLLSYLNSQPDIVGFTWFNIDKEADWRIDSSATSASAFASALSTRR